MTRMNRDPRHKSTPLETSTILIAEDEAVFREFLVEILEEEGYQVIAVPDGEQALLCARQNHVDLVLSDIQMPKITGLELLGALKQLETSPDVIIMTANGRLETALQALRDGAHDYLLKPFEDVEVVMRVIRRTLERRKLIRENEELLRQLVGKNRELEEINQSYRAVHEETTALYHLANLINSTLDLDKVMTMMVTSISELTACTKSLLLLFNEELSILRGHKAVGIDEKILKQFRIQLDTTWINENPIWYLHFHEKPEIIEKLKRDLQIYHFYNAPLTIHERVYGILIAAYENNNTGSSRELELLMQFASNAAIACENAKLHQITEELSIRDGLTGVFNHRFFQERFNQEFHRAKRYREPVALLMIDIDNFKSYNDANGHPKGDYLLKKIVEVIGSKIRTSDVLARYGGEEFSVILPSTDLNGGVVTGEKLRKVVEEYDFEGGESQPLGKITISVGVASYPETAISLPDLLHFADKALYSAKNSGRNNVCHAEKIQSLDY